MDNFQVETAQNIGISQKAAGIADRVLAFLIDSLILIVYIILTGLALAGLGLAGGEQWVYYLVIGLPVFLYYLLWEAFNNGQTPGKAAIRIRVVQLQGARPRFSQYIIRWLLRLIDISLSSGGVAVISILLNGKGQRLGDIAAGTTVISERRNYRLSDTLMVEVPQGYAPRYPQVSLLKDRDIQNIRRVYDTAVNQGNHQVIIRLSEKISKIMEVEPQEKPSDFVKVVIRDYNFYTQQ